MAQPQHLDVFLNDFLREVKKAKKRIFVQSMIVADGSVMKKIEPELLAAKKRGAKIRFQIDWIYTRYYHGHLDLIPQFNYELHKSYKELQQDNSEMVKRFQEAGFEFIVLNPPNPLQYLLPIAGRNHIKIYIVDDVAWLGGLNLYDESFKTFDFMVRYDDPVIVKALVDQFMRIEEKKLTKDKKIKLNENDTLLVDCGIRGQSVILDTAVQISQQAKKNIVVVSQMMPENRLLDALVEAAGNGVSVNIVTSFKKERMFTVFPYYLPYKKFLKRTEGISNIKLRHINKKVHAKLLVVDDNEAVFGSHNFVDTGVKLGTTEIAMWTKSVKLVKDLLGLLP